MYSCIIINTHAHRYQHPIYTDLFGLVVQTCDHHWEVKSCKTAYINVISRLKCYAQPECRHQNMHNYTHYDCWCRLPVRTTTLKRSLHTTTTFTQCFCSSVNGLVGIELTALVQVSDDDHHVQVRYFR